MYVHRIRNEMKRRYLTYYERIEHSFPGNHKDEQLFSEWEMPWDEFAAQATPFICIMPILLSLIASAQKLAQFNINLPAFVLSQCEK